MQSTNKVLCNFDQQLTELEKYTARANLGVLASYSIVTATKTIPVDQIASNNGAFFADIAQTERGIYLLNVNVHIDSGTTPNERTIPFNLYIDFEVEGGGVSGSNHFTGIMTKHDSDNIWYLAMTAVVVISRSDVTKMRFSFTCESNKIPQGVNLKLDVGGMMFGNIEPTP